ncbi:hypothetical protein OF83DRAFT_1027969, partial [Amylostereum chailletii]
EPNKFGLYRVYLQRPTLDPLDLEGMDSVCDAPTLAVPATEESIVIAGPPRPPLQIDVKTGAPFSSISAAHLMEWQNTGSTSKSAAKVDHLAHDILQHDDFVNKDVARFSNTKESKLLDKYLDAFHKRDGWIKSSVTIPFLCEGQEHPSECEAHTFAVDGLYHRRLLDVITQVFESSTAKTLHMTPFQQHWLPDEEGGPTERVYSQMYNSDAMLEAHEAVQKLPLEPGEADVERVIVAVMSGSDTTHL